jgi:hypothetical protein
MIRATFLVLLVVAASSHVLAQQLQDRAAAAEWRWAEYQEVLEASDPVAGAEALRAALADENLGIRTSALWTVLRRRDTLPLTVVLEPGGRIGPGEVPSPGISRIRWNPEQRTFEGLVHSFGFTDHPTGAIVEGKLQIRYGRLKMPIRFDLPADVPLTRKDFVLRHCDAVLAISAADASLSGPLRCEGMAQTLTLRMPLG